MNAKWLRCVLGGPPAAPAADATLVILPPGAAWPDGGGSATFEVLPAPEGLRDAAEAARWARAEVAPRLERARADGWRIVLEAADPWLTAALAVRDCVAHWDEAPAVAVTGETVAAPEADGAEAGLDGAEGEPFVVEAPTPAEPNAPSIGMLLQNLEKATSWSGADHADTKRALEAVLAHPEGDRPSAEARIRRGLRSRELLDRIYRTAVHHGADHPAVAAARRALEAEFRFLARNGRDRATTGDAVHRRIEAEKRRKREQRPLSTVRAGARRHEVRLLAPASSWKLLVDETGSRFALNARGHEGRFVGLLVPEGASLPPLDGRHHGITSDAETQDRLVQAVLDAPVGVFGICLSGLPATGGDLWMAGALEVVHWVLRLLPLDGATRLEVLVENRGEYKSGVELDVALAEVRRHLAETDAERYRHVTLEARFVGKDDDPLNGYVDALAYMWGSRSATSRARLNQSGLRHGCLHEGDPRTLRAAWDVLRKGTSLDGATWAELVRDPDVEAPRGVARLLLERVGAAARTDVALWRRYLKATVDHLESKAVRLGALGAQVAWLEEWQPEGEAMPPALRLAWLVTRLEHANHRGEVDPALSDEVESLGRRLLDEVPELVCQADLDRAVLATNRFEFDEATRVLAPWAAQPPAVPGLRHWARVHSSLGQHAAFRGELREAEARFATALAAFARLSDPHLAEAERRHTATYRAIVAVDRHDLDETERRRRVQAVVDLSPGAIAALAADAGPAHRHVHHLLLRFLVEHGHRDEVEAYLGQRERWGVGEGHPWPLIQARRALLLAERDAAAASDLMRDAAERALSDDPGPTMQLIGATLGTIARLWGAEGPVDGALLAELVTALPAAAERVARLAEALEHGASPRDLLRDVLPFNFR